MAGVNKKVKSGNKVIITIDGAQIGMMQSVDCNDDYAPEAASGIGDIHPQEWVPTMANHRINFEEMVLISGNVRAAANLPQNGDDVLQGLVFDVMVMDKESGGLLRKYSKCSYASGAVQVRKHAIVVSNGVLNALDAGGSGA